MPSRKPEHFEIARPLFWKTLSLCLDDLDHRELNNMLSYCIQVTPEQDKAALKRDKDQMVERYKVLFEAKTIDRQVKILRELESRFRSWGPFKAASKKMRPRKVRVRNEDDSKFGIADTDLTVGDLRRITEMLPDSMPCGVTDHFGDFKGFTYRPAVETKVGIGQSTSKRIKEALIFEAVDVGPEPD